MFMEISFSSSVKTSNFSPIFRGKQNHQRIASDSIQEQAGLKGEGQTTVARNEGGLYPAAAKNEGGLYPAVVGNEGGLYPAVVGYEGGLYLPVARNEGGLYI